MTEIPPIISVDDHVVEPPDLWERWLPAKYREQAPSVVRAPFEWIPAGRQAFRMAPNGDGPEVDFWVYGDFSAGTDIGMTAAGRPDIEIEAGPINFEDMRPGCYRLEERLEDMTLNNVERSMCFPSFPRFCGQVFMESVTLRGEDPDLNLACVRAYNDFMVEEWGAESGGRIIPLQIIPLWDPELAAEEIHRNAARGVRAVTFSEIPHYLGLPSLYDANRHWDPFIQACDETGTVICLHIGSASKSPRSADDSPPGANLTLTSINSHYCLTDWLMSGMLARFPNVKLAMSESQVGWMPYHFQRMDTVWKNHRYSPLVGIPSEMTEPPSTYAKGRIFGCIVEDDFGIEVRGGPLGIDQLTFESDYPHMDSTWPHTAKYAAEALDGLTDDEAHKIVRGNAIDLFDLPATLPA